MNRQVHNFLIIFYVFLVVSLDVPKPKLAKILSEVGKCCKVVEYGLSVDC